MRILGALTVLALMSCGSPSRCTDKTFGAPFCIPDSGTAPAGQALTFQVMDQCNAGCGGGSLACSVSRDGGTITLTLAGQVCEPPPNVLCDLACALKPHDCAIPALEPGDYTVVSAMQSPRTLHVGDAGVASCLVTFP